MTEQQTESLIAQIIKRMQPPVLVMITAATGYRDAIRQRLASSSEYLHLALDDKIEDREQWQDLGETLSSADWQQSLPSVQYKALLLPFLDYQLAADVVNGSLQSPVANRLHDALLAGIPVLALRYHCDPNSELNQLRGIVAGSAYTAHIEATLARLVNCGVTLCTMNELLEKLASGESTPSLSTARRRYLTVKDVASNPSLAEIPDVLMTDAAVDFIKKQKLVLPRK